MRFRPWPKPEPYRDTSRKRAAFKQKQCRTRSTSKTVTVDRQALIRILIVMPACWRRCARQVGSMSPNRVEAAGLRRRGVAARGKGGMGGFLTGLEVRGEAPRRPSWRP